MSNLHIDEMDAATLQEQARELEERHAGFVKAGLKLDLTRGKPAADQLDLANHLDGILQGDFRAEDGTDARNYGGLLGLPESRRQGAQILGVDPGQILAGDNSSLTLMYLYVEQAMLFGVRGPDSAWRLEAEQGGRPVRFLCPVPGYDRHFTICEALGIEMIPVPMTDTGPDMDAVEALVAEDPLIKGIWCVPKYSNPTGCTYSDDTVARFARLPKRAGRHFRIMWDNAYAVHDLDEDPPALDNLLQRAEQEGTDDAVIMLASTSKVTWAGGGVAFMATSADNLKAFTDRLGVLMIGPDKVNQLRHARMLPDADAIATHMRRQAGLIRPKFDRVLELLDAGLEGTGMAQWTRPRGGYFISVDTLPGLAGQVVDLAAEAGVKLTPAGATFPYGRDPRDRNIRLAPTFPPLEDVGRATEVFVNCVRLASVRQRMSA